MEFSFRERPNDIFREIEREGRERERLLFNDNSENVQLYHSLLPKTLNYD